jgi:hypothetical protein
VANFTPVIIITSCTTQSQNTFHSTWYQFLHITNVCRMRINRSINPRGLKRRKFSAFCTMGSPIMSMKTVLDFVAYLTTLSVAQTIIWSNSKVVSEQGLTDCKGRGRTRSSLCSMFYPGICLERSNQTTNKIKLGLIIQFIEVWIQPAFRCHRKLYV